MKLMKSISYDDFLKVELRIGQIIRAEVFEKARKPAYKLWIDFGEELGVKRSSAQITQLYHIDELVGKRVVAVTNFPPKQIADFMSEVLVLGVDSKVGGVTLLGIDHEAPLGTRVY
jgi:tRNA-binding protein